MLPDDPRHGTSRGYQAHCRDRETACDPCMIARRRDKKTQSIERLNGVQKVYSYDELLDVLVPWLALGLGPSAITEAAGMGGHRGGKLLVPGRPVRRSTYAALAAITEADLNPRAKVWSHLTEQRIGSLMAAGHMQTAMPFNPRGQWRYRDRVSVATARDVRDHYAAHQHLQGTAAGTRSQALNAGHRPPAAWDDPGTLAWPLGWVEPLPTRDLDEVLIERVMAGDTYLATTRAERVEVLRRWRAAGRSLNELERQTGWNIARLNRLTREETAA